MNPVGVRGVTLIEMLLAIALLGVLSAFVAASVRGIARATRHVVTAASQHRSSLTMAAVVRHDLTGSVDGDVALESPFVLRYPQPVGSGIVCRATDSSVTIADADWTGGRLPSVSRDSVRVLEHPDSTWQTVAVRGVWSESCGGGRPGITVDIGMRAPMPVVHLFEMVRLIIYSSGGREWVGMAAVGGGSVQPFAGPVLATSMPWMLGPGVVRVAVPFEGPPRIDTLRIALPPP